MERNYNPAELVRRTRKQWNLTIGDLATKSGLGYSTIVKIENNITSPGKQAAIKLGRAFNINWKLIYPIIPTLERYCRNCYFFLHSISYPDFLIGIKQSSILTGECTDETKIIRDYGRRTKTVPPVVSSNSYCENWVEGEEDWSDVELIKAKLKRISKDLNNEEKLINSVQEGRELGNRVILRYLLECGYQDIVESYYSIS